MRVVAALLAIALVTGRAAAQQPSSRAGRDSLAARVASGDSAWDRGDRPAARAAYGDVVRADSGYSSRAVLRFGQLLGWDNQFPSALAVLRLYRRLEPADLDGRVTLARTYAWASRYGTALAHYDSVLALDATYRDAIVGKAQTLAWSDRAPEAEALLVQWIARRDDDVEAWTLLGQFRRWQGDARGAEEALGRALALRPDDAAAREQLAWVRVDRGPAVAWWLIGTEDSERNVVWHREVSVEGSGIGNSRYGVSARMREASVRDAGAIVVPGAVAYIVGRPAGRGITTRAEFGVVQYPEAVGPAALRLRGSLRFSGRTRRGLRLFVGASHDPFDELLATARRAMMFSALDVDASYAVTPRVQLGLAASSGVASGDGSATLGADGVVSRNMVTGALRFTPWLGTQLALTHREVAWDEPQFGLFFAPQRWATTELALTSQRPDDLGLVLAGDLGLAHQAVGFESSALQRGIVPRAAMQLGYRVAPGRELLLRMVFANVAGAGAQTASDYRSGAATVSGRWTF